MSGYVELHAASAFSFLEGASQPEELTKRAGELEMPAMALLDRNGVYGVARFHTSAKRNGVRAHTSDFQISITMQELRHHWRTTRLADPPEPQLVTPALTRRT